MLSRVDSELPWVVYSSYQKYVKQEDVVFVEEDVSHTYGGPTWSMYCICDGHRGVRAAHRVRDSLWQTLGPMLPKRLMPDFDSDDFNEFVQEVRGAMVQAFVRIGRRFRTDASGTTVTAALLCGRLLTVANVGDSDAILDTGTDLFSMTVNDRIQDNPDECKRLSAAGVHLAALSTSLGRPASPEDAGLGPLRCWPGGLVVARSIGDASAGKHITPCPHVCQVAVPKSGARLIMGSDGLWDLICCEEAALVAQRTPVQDAALKIVNEGLLQNNCRLSGDATVVVVDILPSKRGDFPKMVKGKLKRERCRKKAKKQRWDWGNCFCWQSSLQRNKMDLIHDSLRIIAKMDGLEIMKQSLPASPNDSCSSLMAMRRTVSTSSPPKGRRKSAGYRCDQREDIRKAVSLDDQRSSHRHGHHVDLTSGGIWPLDQLNSLHSKAQSFDCQSAVCSKSHLRTIVGPTLHEQGWFDKRLLREERLGLMPPKAGAKSLSTWQPRSSPEAKEDFDKSEVFEFSHLDEQRSARRNASISERQASCPMVSKGRHAFWDETEVQVVGSQEWRKGAAPRVPYTNNPTYTDTTFNKELMPRYGWV